MDSVYIHVLTWPGFFGPGLFEVAVIITAAIIYLGYLYDSLSRHS